MKRILFFAFCTSLLGFTSQSLCSNKVITCPAVTVKHYGKTSYYDSNTGKIWNLTWSNKQSPRWVSISIPQTTLCGKARSSKGLYVNYQCAVLQCKSDAVVATLEGNQSVKCFSAYVSTQNTFYCDSFSTNPTVAAVSIQ